MLITSSLGLCLARRNRNKIEFFLNLGANIRKSGNYLLYLPQVLVQIYEKAGIIYYICPKFMINYKKGRQ